MKNFLNKLDRQLGNWIETMDGQLQEPVVRAITGEVFVHGTNGHYAQEETTFVEVEQTGTHIPPGEGVVDYPIMQPSPLRKRTASAGDC